MTRLHQDPAFADAFASLEAVTLNPRRHTAANARAHCLAVSAMTSRLAAANRLGAVEAALLADLALCHDIGKIRGDAAPATSLEVLGDCGITPESHPQLAALVKWHDTNLPWWIAAQRGQAPSDKAWRRLAAAVDVRLLALFMVADRVDSPGGWARNAPLRWFLDQARRRGLTDGLRLHLPDHPSEVSAGGALVEGGRALLIRVRDAGWELPKGGIEFDERAQDAAIRELREETGVRGALEVSRSLGAVTYSVGRGDEAHRKRVCYFAVRGRDISPGRVPAAVREVAWFSRLQISDLPLVNDELRPLIAEALALVALDPQQPSQEDGERGDAR